jgi:hypothetical protein
MTAKKTTAKIAVNAADIAAIMRDADIAAKAIDVLTRRVESLEKSLSILADSTEKLLECVKKSEPRTWSQWLRGE